VAYAIQHTCGLAARKLLRHQQCRAGSRLGFGRAVACNGRRDASINVTATATAQARESIIDEGQSQSKEVLGNGGLALSF